MILITGGAGFIGSHTAIQLKNAGYKDMVVLDNLSTGVKDAIPEGIELVVGDIANAELVKNTIKKYNIDSVLHFAAYISVEESVQKPFEYYDNNYIGSYNLIKTCAENGVKNFVFSSTCATLGTQDKNPVSEDFIPQPESPYARSKLMIEWLLEDMAKISDMKYVVLRYFNVAGANHEGLNGLRYDAFHLIAACCRSALGKQDKMKVFGDDYSTRDGTCIRDYIHIDDLADLHVKALKFLEDGNGSDLFHCGYGTGFSVKEVIEEFQKTNNVSFDVEYHPRRAGDIVEIYNNPTKVTKAFNWAPKYDDISIICQDSYNWELKKNI